jgi:hypothetical protein
MTREEAIEILEKEKAYMLGHGGDRQAVALDMAIKALKQEPTTKDGSNRSIIYKAKKSKEIQEDLDKLRELNEPTTKNDLGVKKIEVRKPCINYEDGCEEWAGCPCVHFKCRK